MVSFIINISKYYLSNYLITPHHPNHLTKNADTFNFEDVWTNV
jgi:hypothetical protein